MFRVTQTVMGLMSKVITERLLIILVMIITVQLEILIFIQDLMELNQQIVIIVLHRIIPLQLTIHQHQFTQVLEGGNITTIVTVIKPISVDKLKIHTIS